MATAIEQEQGSDISTNGTKPDAEQKQLRYPATLDGLKQAVGDLKFLIDLALRLGAGIRVWGTEVERRREMARKFVKMVLDGDPQAQLERTIAFCASLRNKMEEEFDAFYSASLTAFMGTTNYVRTNAPDLFAENKGKIDAVITAFKAAINDEDVQLEEMVSPYLDCHELLISLQLKAKDIVRQEEEEVARKEREKSDRKAEKSLRKLIDGL